MEKRLFEVKENDLISRTAHILINAYKQRYGAVPDLFPFQQPLIYDNLIRYEDSTLDEFMRAVNAAVSAIFDETYPKTKERVVIKLPSDVLEKIIWTVFGVLKVLPIVDNDETYDDFPLDPNYGEQGHIDMTHNRVLAFEKKSAQERLEKLHNALLDILNKRCKYLEDLFSAREDQEKENIMAHIELCMQEIAPIQRDIHGLCQLFELPNQLLPIEPEESSSFSQIVHWNYIQRQQKARQEFELSEPEEALLPFVPASFRETEWPLFQFTFVPPEEIEEHNIGESDVFREDIRLLRERSLERKMMIGYYILHQLALYRHKRITLDPRHVTFLTEAFEKLSIEIDLLRRKLMNKKGTQVHIKNQLSEIDDLITSMQNVLKIPKIDPKLSRILEGIMGVMHTFYANCNQAYSDPTVDPLEIESIIETFRSVALEHLQTYQSQMMEIETSSSPVESNHFDRVADMMNRSISFLRGEQ